jgi:hypothetical protein
MANIVPSYVDKINVVTGNRNNDPTIHSNIEALYSPGNEPPETIKFNNRNGGPDNHKPSNTRADAGMYSARAFDIRPSVRKPEAKKIGRIKVRTNISRPVNTGE